MYQQNLEPMQSENHILYLLSYRSVPLSRMLGSINLVSALPLNIISPFVFRNPLRSVEINIPESSNPSSIFDRSFKKSPSFRETLFTLGFFDLKKDALLSLISDLFPMILDVSNIGCSSPWEDMTWDTLRIRFKLSSSSSPNWLTIWSSPLSISSCTSETLSVVTRTL